MRGEIGDGLMLTFHTISIKGRLVMGKIATFKAKYLKDGHISIPKGVMTTLSLRKGDEIRIMLEKEKFDKKDFLGLFGIWKDKSDEEIDFYREILKERKIFGRGEIKL
ncbi:MAG: hypothetical protein COY50_10045 [Deltaproteobacteria bacterium CG_4_10_14_0_8_um_filter_43_12]|nr:MAG: hypothetical protein COY50_10045 [Deltaproteobacteria bacterium CG_4_10_14_0_8_um_filter_43_12]